MREEFVISPQRVTLWARTNEEGMSVRRVAEGGASQNFGSVLVAAISFAHPPALQNCLAFGMRFGAFALNFDALSTLRSTASGYFAPVQFLSFVHAGNWLAVLR